MSVVSPAPVDSERECFKRNGFTFVRSLLTHGQVESLRAVVTSLTTSNRQAGARGLLQRSPEIAWLAKSPQLIEPLTLLAGRAPFAVRGLFFDKTAQANWRVAWHQDLTIAVRAQAEVSGFGPWSVKAGVVHTHAPAGILQQMLTVRVHLDDTDLNNGALQVIPGSHLRGRLDEAAVIHEARGEAVPCAARASDVLVMRPLLLHSSLPAVTPTHRRVIHIEYAVDDLPAPLQWFERPA